MPIFFANIWNHPKTSIVGVLLGLVTVCSVLSQQGITLGNAGTGTVVALISGLATAFLGLISKDWGSSSDSGSTTTTTAKLGAIALMALLLTGTVPMVGCTVTSAELKSDTSSLAVALTSLSAALASTDATTAADLSTAAAGLNAVVSSWDTSTAASKINTIASGVETVLAKIPSTSQYVSLVAIAVAAVDALVANVGTKDQVAARERVSSPAMSAALVDYRQRGVSQIHHRFGRSAAGDFKAAWNSAIASNHLAAQPIR